MSSGRRHAGASARQRTWALAGGLLLLAVALQLAVPAHDPPRRAWWIALALCLVFVGTEAGDVSVEFRRQTYSFTLSGAPLLLGLLYLPVWQVIAIRALATVAVMLGRRLSVLKTGYNVSAFAFETALAGTLARAVEPSIGVGRLSLRAAVVLCVTLIVVDLVMSGLVLAVIWFHGEPLSRALVLDACLSAAIFNLVALTLGLLAATLLSDGRLGWALLGLTAVIAGSAYRAYTVLFARHGALSQASDFVAEDDGSTTVESLAAGRISRIRALLSATAAEVVLVHPDDAECLVLRVNEFDQLTSRSLARADLDWLIVRVLEQDEGVLVRRGTRDPGLLRWLADRGFRDAVLAPLTNAGELRGILLVRDRLTEHATFTKDDLVMVRTLAGHLGVTLRSTRLLEKLRHEATHDVLTGLANRALLADRLVESLTVAERASARVGVLILDLDRFKEINDALGHDVGDALLRTVGTRLSQAAPADATVARLGGDEFAVMLPHLPPTTAIHDAEAVAARLMESLVAPVFIDEGMLTVDVSIGVSVSDDTHNSGVELLRQADIAMYDAKSAGHAVARYTQELDRGRAERLALVADLRLALSRDELMLEFQPKLDLATMRVTGAEALVRWRHPRLGLLTPDVFIPLAESTGLVEPLTQLVLAKALNACHAWRAEGLDATVAVNLSARNVTSPELPGLVAAALRSCGLPPEALILEITESSVMSDAEAAVATLRRLANLGVAVSLDDFGTGYSSLGYLQRLPVHELKIDRSFVVGLGSDAPNSAAANVGQDRASEVLVRSIVGLARAFGLVVVAEGVEDGDTLERLADMGCDRAQGYLIGKPGSPEALMTVARAFASGAHPAWREPAGRRPTRLHA